MRKLPHFKSIRTRQTFWLLVSTLLPLVLFSTINIQQRISTLNLESFSRLVAIRDLKAQQMNTWFEERHGGLHVLSLSLEHYFKKGSYLSDNKEDIRYALGNIKQNYSAYGEIFLLDAHTGKVLVSSNITHEGDDESDDLYFSEPLRLGDSYIKDIYYSDRLKKPAMTFSTPVFVDDQENEIVAILVMKIDLAESLFKIINERTALGETGEVLIVNSDTVALNQLKYSPASPLKLLIKAKPAKYAANGKTGIIETKDYRNEPVLAAYTYLPLIGWGFVVKQDQSEVHAPVNDLLRHLLFLILSIICASIFVAIILSKRLTQPILDMAKVAMRIKAGDRSVRNKVSHEDELGLLAVAFNDMADSLKVENIQLNSELQLKVTDLESEIIQREQVEETLAVSEERFKTIFEEAPLGITVIESLTGCIQEVNQKFAEITGRTIEELKVIDWMSITHPDDVQKDLDNMALMNAKKIANFNMIKRYIQLDGSIVWVNMAVAPISVMDKNNPLHLCMIEDITHKRNIEEQLRRSQKMESIGQLAGGIAHDFNNLLAIMQSNFEFLEDFNTSKDDDFQKWIDSGLKTVQRGSSLTRRLLNFSRTDVVGTEIVNINKVITELKELIERSLTPNITIEFNLGENVLELDINPNEFQDALINLAINAKDAMPKGGTLTISSSDKVMDEKDIKSYPGLEVGNYTCVSVSDTGQGMDKTVLENALDPFFTTKEKGKGTGLGLSMVYGFVKRNKGYINLYSEVGYGTTVRLYLPSLADKNKKDKQDKNDSGAHLILTGTETILVVDDEVDILEAAKHRLESLGYRVLTAGNGHEALEVINHHKEDIDLLFSDVVMPGGMSGYELALETQKRALDIKVLLSSGFTDNLPKAHELLKLHIPVMEKPYTKMELAKKVRETLDSD